MNAAAVAAGKNRTASPLVASAVRGSQGGGVASSAVASNAASGVSGGTLTVSSGSSVSAGVVKLGAGTLSLGNSSTYSGGSVSGATLITNGNGNGLTRIISNNIVPIVTTTVPNTSGISLGNTGASTIAGGTVAPGTILVGNPGTVVNGGTIYTNNGVLTVNGANTGVLNVNAGGSLHTITTANRLLKNWDLPKRPIGVRSA